MYDFNYYGSDSKSNEEKQALPDLCHKCGNCCRSATTYHSHKKLMEMAEAGDKEAIEFLEIFEPYESIEAARDVVPEQVEQVLRIAQTSTQIPFEEVTFYHCRYVSPEGLCGIYERRPRFCREAPGHGWSAMPPGCGFEGWQFEQREKIKRTIRNMRNSMYLMEQLSPDGISHPARPDCTIEEMKTAIEEKIKPWVRFGAQYW